MIFLVGPLCAPAFGSPLPDEPSQQMSRFMQQGDFRKAVISGLEAEKIYVKEGMKKEQIRILIRISDAYQSIGQYKKALESLKKALGYAEDTGDKVLMAGAMGRLGRLSLLINRPDDAEALLKEAVILAKKENSEEVAASIMNDTGNLYVLKKSYKEALGSYKEALGLAHKTDNRSLTAAVLSNYARAMSILGEYKDAEVALNASYEAYNRLDHSHDKAYGLINIGQTFRRLGRNLPDQRRRLMESALMSYKASLTVANEINDALASSYALGYTGKYYEEAGLMRDALRFTHRALFQAQNAGAPESLYLWQWQRGRIFKAEGEMDEAVSAYRGAVNTLQSIRQEFLGDCRIYNQLSFQDVIEPVYTEFVDLLLRQADVMTDKMDRETYLIEAVQAVEFLKTAELQDYFINTCVVPGRTKITKNDMTLANTAIVYFMPLQERLAILLGLPDGIKAYEVNINKNILTAEIRQFRQMLEKRTTHEYLLNAQKLYDWIIRPYESDLLLQKVETIVFVPEGPIRTIPMSALHDGKAHLIERFSVATIPGLGLTDPHTVKNKSVRALLAGLSEPVQGFAPLDYVPNEMRAVRELYRGKLLMNDDFRIPAIQNEFEHTPYSIVHIASHGEFFDNSQDTYLLTWSERLNMDQLERFIRTGRFRKKPVELLTLSACKSAAGNDRAALGLAGVSVKAGAKSAMATLWYVNDEASSVLVAEFYRQVHTYSLSKSKALQQAQLKLLKDSRYKHPCYWSPFLLIGNWL